MYHSTPNASHYSDTFTSNGLATASPAKILIMCFDRLDRDLTVARSAMERGDHELTNESLHHAQDLLGEVAGMLDVEAWEHAASLLSVYDYVLRLLAKANILKAEALVVEAQQLLSEIGDAFRGAATQVTAAPPASPPQTGSPALDATRGSGLSLRA